MEDRDDYLPFLILGKILFWLFIFWLFSLWKSRESKERGERANGNGLMYRFGKGMGRARIPEFGDPVERERQRRDEQEQRDQEEARKRLNRERRAEEKSRKRAEQQRVFREQKDRVDIERSKLLDKPIPPDVMRAMRDFLSGVFAGEDRSPLAFAGYRVGKTKGLAPLDRQRRLEICFRMEIPSELPSKYQVWGSLASLRRYEAILKHLKMLADMRRGQSNLRFAVADWDADKEWFQFNINEMARRFGKYGYSN